MKMKKILISMLLLVTSCVLTSFKQPSLEDAADYNWKYYDCIKAVYEPGLRVQEEVTIYVYYKQVNNGRLYGFSQRENEQPSLYNGEVTRNKEYNKKGSRTCKFRYKAACCMYFNANLPYFVE